MNEANYMATPFETEVMESLVQSLQTATVTPDLVDLIENSYRAEKLPSADSLLESIKQHSGGKAA